MLDSRHISLGTSDPVLLDRDALRAVLRPGPVARLHARLRAGALDRRLARGADPGASPALAHRAARLTAPDHRRELADLLDRFVTTAGAPARRRLHGRFRMATARSAVQAAETELRDLAETVRGPRPLYARGLAMLGVLLADGTGPLYVDGPPDALADELESARRALLG